MAVLWPGLKLSFLSGEVDNPDEDEDMQEEALDKELTKDMSEDEVKEYEMKKLDKGMIYADVNPLMKKAYEAQLEEGGGAEEVDENAPTLLSLTEQIELYVVPRSPRME